MMLERRVNIAKYQPFNTECKGTSFGMRPDVCRYRGKARNSGNPAEFFKVKAEQNSSK
jgi:hypothetical protein